MDIKRLLITIGIIIGLASIFVGGFWLATYHIIVLAIILVVFVVLIFGKCIYDILGEL